MVNIFETPSLYTPPLVFDFVFAPAQDYEKSSQFHDEKDESSKTALKSDKTEFDKSKSSKVGSELPGNEFRLDEGKNEIGLDKNMLDSDKLVDYYNRGNRS